MRRLAQEANLTEQDVAELAALCRDAHNLRAPNSTAVVAKPLAAADLPQEGPCLDTVSLKAIADVQNVNALAPGQRLAFGAQGITAVYGSTASGKSGYVRILKRLCRARGAPKPILPNVFSKTARGTASATVIYALGEKDQAPLPWRDGQSNPSALRTVSVFDSSSAPVYIDQQNDVAFRPFGLHLLDGLANTALKVRAILQVEKVQLEASAAEFTHLEGDTAVGVTIKSLDAPNAKERFEALAKLPAQESARLEELRTLVRRLDAEDPAKRANELKAKAVRLQNLAATLGTAEAALSSHAAKTFQDLLAQSLEATKAANLAANDIFGGEPLPGVGSETWRLLWEAARSYSTKEAYKEEQFPFIGEGARCVLCHQILEPPAQERLRRFQSYIKAQTQAKATVAASAFATARSAITALSLETFVDEALLSEIEILDAQCAADLRQFRQSAGDRRTALLKAADDGNWAKVPTLASSPQVVLRQKAESLRTDAARLEKAAKPENLTTLRQELAELEARHLLAGSRTRVLAEIERLQNLQKVSQCITETDTTAISHESTRLTKAAVTDALCMRFSEELRRLGVSTTRVALHPSGSQRGVMYHAVRLDSKLDTKAGDVLSDGEQRCIALAAFLTELATASHRSSLVLDDPVCSLDHRWCRKVAERLVEEGRSRQVIVFTHDLVFLKMLSEQAEEQRIPIVLRHLDRDPVSCGICADSPPAIAMKVHELVGCLRSRLQALRKTRRERPEGEYQVEASRFYGLLREGWERAVEEVALNDTVARFRRSVETKRLEKVVDLTEADYAVVDAAMSTCSKYITGHAQARAMDEPVPEPDELERDIQNLDAFVKCVRKRREKH